MAYPHKWSPISYKSSAGQRKHIGQRPMLYRWTTSLMTRPLLINSSSHHPAARQTFHPADNELFILTCSDVLQLVTSAVTSADDNSSTAAVITHSAVCLSVCLSVLGLITSSQRSVVTALSSSLLVTRVRYSW